MSAERTQPSDLKTQMVQQFDLFVEMSLKPEGKGGLPASKEYYRNKIAERLALGGPFIRHLSSANDEPSINMRRYNTLATVSNFATEWFRLDEMSYREYCAFAQAAEYDVLSHYGDLADAENFLDSLSSQIGDNNKFFEDFSVMIDKAEAGDYNFYLPRKTQANMDQLGMLDNIRNISRSTFSLIRNYIQLKIQKDADDISAVEAVMNDQRMIGEYGINLNQPTLPAWFELDAVLSTPAQTK